MLKSALEGLKGRRSRHASQSRVRGGSLMLSGSDLVSMPKHLYPPNGKG
jgi:hypothetical protein